MNNEIENISYRGKMQINWEKLYWSYVSNPNIRGSSLCRLLPFSLMLSLFSSFFLLSLSSFCSLFHSLSRTEFQVESCSSCQFGRAEHKGHQPKLVIIPSPPLSSRPSLLSRRSPICCNIHYSLSISNTYFWFIKISVLFFSCCRSLYFFFLFASLFRFLFQSLQSLFQSLFLSLPLLLSPSFSSSLSLCVFVPTFFPHSCFTFCYCNAQL